MAHALGLRLAGPRVYGGRQVEDAWMGDGRATVSPDDIERAIGLAWQAWWALLLLVVLLAIAS
jgi:adenosylcobinamide-phosphate synthase